MTVTVDGVATTKAAADVSKIEITGGDGDDTVRVDASVALAIPVSFDGGKGANVLATAGGAGSDWAYDGAGGTVTGGGIDSLTFVNVGRVEGGGSQGHAPRAARPTPGGRSTARTRATSPPVGWHSPASRFSPARPTTRTLSSSRPTDRSPASPTAGPADSTRSSWKARRQRRSWS